MSTAHELTAPRPRAPAFAVPAVGIRPRVILVVVAVLALTALTFLEPSTPTYDPLSWIIWGREILHLDLSTADGPSWKPLPVLLTTPFALFGDAAPDLWLFVARAGAIAGVVALFQVARRLGGLPAGAAAAAAYALAPWTLRNAGLGNSEGLLVALALGAVDRHLAGRYRAAFLLALGAALLRPEAWSFVGLYGLWLLWRHRSAVRTIVIAGFAALPVLWLLPELWGSGDLLRAMHRAHSPNPNSAAFAFDPIKEVIGQFTGMLSWPVLLGWVVLSVIALAGRTPGRRDGRVAACLLGGLAVWVAEVALMTSDGFSGNARYLILPAALACVLGGVGVGWAVRLLPVRSLPTLAVVVVALGAGFVFAKPWFKYVQPLRQSLEYQASLADGFPEVVTKAGGAQRVLRCGVPYTGPFQVPLAAWNLRLHIGQVHDAAHTQMTVPAVVFRTRDDRGRRPTPSLDPIGGESAVHTLAAAGGWRIVERCT